MEDLNLKLFTRQRFIELVSNPKFGYEDMFQVVQMYIFYRKKEKWQPSSVNLNQLQAAFDYAQMWMAAHFEICVLRDKKDKVIKIY